MVFALFVLGGCATTGGAAGDGSYDSAASATSNDTGSDWAAQQQTNSQALANQEVEQANEAIGQQTVQAAQQAAIMQQQVDAANANAQMMFQQGQ